MEIQFRATKQQYDYMVNHWEEECGLKVEVIAPEIPVRYEKENGTGVHWIKIIGTRNNPAAQHIIQGLINYSSSLIDHLQDARRVLEYVSKQGVKN